MELLNNFNLTEWSWTIGWTLIHSLWQTIIIGGLICLLFRFVSKDNAKIRYALSSLGLVFICVASTITFYRYIPSNTSIAISDFTSQIKTIEFIQQKETFFARLWIQLQAQLENTLPYLVKIWMIGMFFLSINLIVKYIHARQLKKRKTYPLRSDYKVIADRLVVKYNLKQNILFKESGLLDIPSVIGYFKPIVLLPVSMLSGIPENQLEIIIAHELAHIRRHDYLLQFIQGIIELVFFYHPVVWWLSSVINDEREHICDDLAVKVCGEPLSLIKALNNMEAIRKKQYEMVLGFSGKKGIVLNRIKRILRPKTSTNPKRERFMLSGVFTLLFAGLFLISNFAISGNTDSQKSLFSKINSKSTDQKNDSSVNLTLGDTTNTPLYILDGIKISAEAAKKVHPDDIESMNVLKGKEAIKKYGESAKNGAIEIDSKGFKFKDPIKVDNALYIIDGKELSAKESERINPNNIENINVLKDEQAIEKYGNKGTNGVIEITSKSQDSKNDSAVNLNLGDTKNLPLYILDGEEITRAQLEQIPQNSISSISVLKDASAIKLYDKKGENGIIQITSKSDDYTFKMNEGNTKNPPIYILDGKRISSKKMEKIDPDDIENINVLKGEHAIEKYGKKGENGVIEITSKSTDQKSNSTLKLNIEDSIKAPIFLLDGLKIDRIKMDEIPPNDIESIIVLKDKSAIKKYGKKGINGVIEITSKPKNSKHKPVIKIKGSSINNPLYIVDGKKISALKADEINPDNIESIDVLKGEPAIEKYGEEAKNGVVIITSKSKN